MTLVKVEQKYQVTIPGAIRRAANIQEGDALEVCVENGNIILIPQTRADEIGDHDSSILSVIGANKGSGLYKSVKEVDSTINELRNEWD